ncbi:MAG: hypothetical protein ABIR57_12025 [Aeromicrobium sp.]
MTRQWSVAEKDVAKNLFGRALRVALGEWIDSRNSAFYLTEAQEAMKQTVNEFPSNVTTALEVFVKCGMLDESRIATRRYFTQMESPFWTIFVSIDQALNTSRGQPTDAARP